MSRQIAGCHSTRYTNVKRSTWQAVAAPAVRAVSLCLFSTLTAAAAPTATTACFDEIEQSYQWDDGGFNWSHLPDPCSPHPASPAERKWGGSVQIRASGHDAIVIEEDYAWGPPHHDNGNLCPPFVKTVTKTTRIAKGGILYETRQVDSDPPQRTQRHLQGNQMIYIPNIQSVPSPSDPLLQLMGTDTIAGQPCTRVAPKPTAPGAGTWAMCIFVAPINCPLARYLQPMELLNRGPDGTVTVHGRTTSLRYGSHGQVVPTDSIRAP